MDILHDLASEAKYYSEALQWRVVPCHTPIGSGCSCGKSDCKKPGKHPRLSSWQTKASDDAEQVAKWWQEWPSANVGLVLGPGSAVFDIEYDDAEGEATAEELLSHIRTPKYMSHRSTHHLFYFPDTLKPAKAVYRWRGLELRFGTDSRGALSIVPPSLHASGNRYEWLLHPSRVGLAEPPAWLSEAMSEATAKAAEPLPIALPSDGLTFTMATEKETLQSHPGASEGNRHSKLLELVGRHIGTQGPSAELVSLALTWAGRCSPPMEQSEVLQVVSRLADKELGKRSEAIGKAPENNKVVSGAQAIALPTPKPRTFKARRYDTIEAVDVEWLWQDRIAIGKLSLLVGEPGLGKTFCSLDIAAKVSTGSPFADGARPPLGDCAILTAEDGAGDTIRPRLDAAGADVARILHIDGVGAEGDAAGFPSLKDDLGALEQFLKDNPELRLIIIDPLAAYLGDKIDSHSNTQVRAVLGPLCELAERYRVALLGITHLAKSEAKAINRVIGSIAFVAAARSCWLVAADSEDEDKRLFLPVKNNLARCSGLSYSVVDGRCVWDSEAVLIGADDIGSEDDTPRDEAKQWLLAKLATAMPAKWVWAQAKADGIAERTLKRAKKELGVISDKLGDAWVWRLPNQELEPASEGTFIVQ